MDQTAYQQLNVVFNKISTKYMYSNSRKLCFILQFNTVIEVLTEKNVGRVVDIKFLRSSFEG